MESATFGDWLRQLRELARLSRAALAKATADAVPEKTIQAVEEGRQARLLPGQLAALADALGVSVDFLLRGKGGGGIELTTARHARDLIEIKEVVEQMTQGYDNLKRNATAQARGIEEVREYEKSLHRAIANIRDSVNLNTKSLHAVIKRLEKVEQSQTQILANQNALGADNQTLEQNMQTLSSNIAIMAADVDKRLSSLEGNSAHSPDDIEAARERGARWSTKVDETLEQQTAKQFNFDMTEE